MNIEKHLKEDYRDQGGITWENFLESRKSLRRKRAALQCTIINPEEENLFLKWNHNEPLNGKFIGYPILVYGAVPPGTIYHLGIQIDSGELYSATCIFYKEDENGN